jgi:hypothetical protein
LPVSRAAPGGLNNPADEADGSHGEVDSTQ